MTELTHAERRAELLSEFGGSKLWVRWKRRVRVVEARVIASVPMLGWRYADPGYASMDGTRWIAADTFRRLYRDTAAAEPISAERLQFARDLADPHHSLSVPAEAKAVILDLLEEIARLTPADRMTGRTQS